MSSYHTPVTDDDIARHRRAVDAAAIPHDEAVAKQRTQREAAKVCADEARALEAERPDLLRRAFLGDEKVDKQLTKLDLHVQALRQREKDALDAAALLDPEIATHAKNVQQHAQALNEVIHQRLVDQHTADGEALRKGLGHIYALIDAYVKSGDVADRSHRSVFGVPDHREYYEPPIFRALRSVIIGLRHTYRHDTRALDATGFTQEHDKL
jgi:hypothetical protein